MNTKILLLIRLLAWTGAIGATTVYVSKAMERKGVVTGIIYTIENPSVVIDGQILYEGDTIYGVEVIKIERSTVEFSKDGNQWTQRVREKPNPIWDEFEKAARKKTEKL